MKSLNSQSLQESMARNSSNKQISRSALPTTYNFHRNNKSLKILNIHLKEYKSYKSTTDLGVKQNYAGMFGSNVYGSMGMSKLKDDMTSSDGTNKDYGFADRDKEFVAKC